MSILCFLSQYLHSCTKPSGSGTSGEEGAQFSRQCGIPKSKKIGEASHVRPPLLNEPVGGRLIGVLYCHPRRKSFHFFCRVDPAEEKAKKGHTHTTPCGFPRQASPPIPTLGYRGRSPAASPHLGGQLESAFLKVEGDNFPVHHIHGVKLVWGAPGQVKHVEARAFESNNASPPKGRAIRELLEQVVSMVHRSPFLATH